MITLHKDTLYKIPNEADKLVQQLHGWYHPKFINLFDQHNIPYEIVEYEGYSDIFIGRFAQDKDDMEQHTKVYPKLHKHYGDNMWPNKTTYEYFEDKIKQFELIDERYRPYAIVCNNFDELLEHVEVGTVVKSSKGAGSESLFHIYDEQFLQKEILEQLIGESLPNGGNFFPCFVMDYIDVEFEHRIIITEDEIYGVKIRQFKNWDSPTSFPHDIDYLNIPWYKRKDSNWIQENLIGLEEEEFNKELLDEMIRIKKELNTPNLKFDIMDNKILEFCYVYGEILPGKDYYISYDYHNDKFNKVDTSIPDFLNKQQKSILKYFKLI